MVALEPKFAILLLIPVMAVEHAILVLIQEVLYWHVMPLAELYVVLLTVHGVRVVALAVLAMALNIERFTARIAIVVVVASRMARVPIVIAGVAHQNNLVNYIVYCLSLVD